MAARCKTNEEYEWSLYFGRNLQCMLHRKQINQGYLAKHLGTTNAMISHYIRGVSIPSVYKVARIAEIIGCDISDLVKANYKEY